MNQTRRANLEWAFLLLRLSLGLLFLIAGFGKFHGGYSSAVNGIVGMFASNEENWLPIFMIKPYAYILPFVEVAFGALLVVGFLTRPVLVLTGLTLLSLAFGMMVAGNHGTVANNLVYVAMAAAAMGLSEFNRYSIDGALGSTGLTRPD